MLIYDKLNALLKERGLQWKDLCAGGLGINTPAKFSHNRNMNTDNIDKVCTYLNCQPSDIMEWVSEEEYEKRKASAQNEEKKQIEAQIQELQRKLDKM